MDNKKTFIDILNIAREKVRKDPYEINMSTEDAIDNCLQGIRDEVDEVKEEVRKDNEVYLVDEVGDISWDYARLLAFLEERGLIKDAEEVFEHGFNKYEERSLANINNKESDPWVPWNKVKEKQKKELKKKHEEKYGK